MALTATFVADFSSFQTAVEKAQTSLKSFEQDANKVGTSLNRMGDSFSGKKIIQDGALMTKALSDMGGVSKLTESELRRVATATAEATAKMKALGIQAPADLKRLADEAAKAVRALEPLGDRLRKAGTAMADAGMAITKFTAPLALAAGFSLKAAIDFESGFAGVRKTVKATEPELLALAVGFRKLSTEMPISTIELTKVGEAAGQLGIKKDSILSFTATMAKLGATTNLTADEAAVAMARFSNIMGTPQEAVGKLGAALVALGNDGASTEKEIVDMALRIAGAGKTIGMTEGQVLGLANALSSVGIEADMGGSAISRVMVNIAMAVNKGGESLGEFAKVAKMSNEEFSKLFTQDSGAAMAAFIAGLSKIKSEGGNLLNTLEALGFSEIRVRDTLLRVANAGDLVTNSMKLGNQSMKDGTALNEEFAKRVATTESQLRIMWNRINDVSIELGNALIPAMRSAADAVDGFLPYLKGAVEWFAKLPDPVKTSAIAFAALAVAAGPTLYIVGQLTISVGALSTAFATLSGMSSAGAAVTAIRSIGTAAAGSQTLLLGLSAGLAGIAVAGGLVLVAKQFEQLQTDLQAATGAGGAIKGVEHGLQSIHHASVKAAQSAGLLNTEWSVTLPTLAKATSAVGGSGGFTDALKKARTEITALAPAIRRDLAEAIRSGAFSMEQLRDKSGLSEAALKLFSSQIKESGKASDDAEKKLTKFQESVQQFGNVAMRSVATLTPFRDVIAGVYQHDLPNLSYQLMASQVKVDMLGNAVKVNLVPSLEKLGGALDQQRLKAVSFADNLKSSLAGIPDVLKQAFIGGGNLIGAMKAIGVDLANAITAPIIEGLSKLQKHALAAGTAAAAGLGGAVGGGIGATVAGIASGLGGAALAASAWGAGMATAGVAGSLALGAATLGIGAAAVGVVMLAKKWFAHRKEVQENTKAIAAFQESIWATLTPAQVMEAQGRTWAATVIGVRDAYLATGGSAADAEADVKAMWDSTTKGAVASKAAMDRVNAAFVKQKAITERIAAGALRVEELGVKLAGVLALTPEMEEAFARAFDAQTPEDFLAAIGDISRVVDEAARAHDGMTEAAKKYGITIDGMGRAWQQQELNTKAKELLGDYELLTKGGADHIAIVKGMGKSVDDYIDKARKMGIEVPSSMKPMLEEMIRAGKLTDDDGKKIKDLEGLGVKFGDSMEVSMGKVATALERLILLLETKLGPAIANVPDGDFTIRGKVVMPDKLPKGYDLPDVEMMASGGRGVVTKPTLFMAGEAGSEEFAFRPANKRFESGGSGGAQIIDIAAFKEEFALSRRQQDKRDRELPFVLAMALKDAQAH